MRAIEWNAWPSFISQPIIPILFLFCPWLTVIISLVVVNLLWALLIQPHFVLPPLAGLAVALVRLKLITIPVVVVLLALREDYVLAAVSLCWPLFAGLGSFVPGSLYKTRRVFMASLGYEYPAPHAGGLRGDSADNAFESPFETIANRDSEIGG